MKQTTDSGLVRGIRRWDLVAVAINGIIGAGIFGLPSQVFKQTGAYSIIAFATCALVVTLIILCFAEVGSRYSETGGPYLYAREAFGPVIGFEVGWLMWIARLTAFAANCNLMVSYVGFFWPSASDPFWRAVIIITVVLLLTTINIIGVRDAAIVSNVFTIGKLLPIMLFVGVGIFFISPERFAFNALSSYGNFYDAFSGSVLILIYAFTGFEMAVIPAGEVRDPQRNLPRALLIATGVVTLLYILIQAVSIGTLPGLADSERPIADASFTFMGTAGASIITAGVLVSITGNLIVLILAGSRLPFAMAERGELPQIISATHNRFHTPHIAIIITSAVMLALTLSGTFIYAVTISTIARLLAYTATCAALPILRRRANAPQAMFKIPFGTIVALISLALAGWLLSKCTFTQARDSLIAIAIGLLIYGAYYLARRSRRDKPYSEQRD